MENNRSTTNPRVTSPEMTETSETSRARRMGNQAAERVSRGVDSASSRVGDGLASTASGLQRAAGGVAERLEGAGRYLRESDARTMGSDLTEVIRNHPKAAIGVGLGLGFLLGRMLSR